MDVPRVKLNDTGIATLWTNIFLILLKFEQIISVILIYFKAVLI
jgi:hypothetical protein